MAFEPLGVDNQGALEFFRTGLEATPSVQSRPGQPPELAYCASILAHFSSTSSASTEGAAAPRHLFDVFDQYVVSTLGHGDAELMEDAGAKTLLLLGFFYRGMASRHNVDWYRRLGRSFFHEAASLTADQKRRYILMLMSHRFGLWQTAFCELEHQLREHRFLLRLDDIQNS
jgi:hypothetical protein